VQIKVSRMRIRSRARNDSCLIVACRCALFRYVLFSRIADKHPMKFPVSHVSDRVCRTHSRFRGIESSFRKSRQIYLAARLEIYHSCVFHSQDSQDTQVKTVSRYVNNYKYNLSYHVRHYMINSKYLCFVAFVQF